MARFSRWQALLILGGLSAVQPKLAAEILISEIMYHPVGTNVAEQWFELHNNGTNTTDLNGWKVTKGVEFAFPSNTVVAADGYLVVAADAATFASNHPGVTNFLGGWSGKLGSHLRVVDATGQTVSDLEFGGEGDWAERRLAAPHFGHRGWEWYAEHDGLGKTLELVNAALPNTQALNWASSTTVGGTPGQPNSVAKTNVAPMITAVAHRPVVPQPTDPVTVSTRILDEHTDGLVVTLHWRVDGAANFSAVPMSDDGQHDDGLAGDGIYAAVLPAHANATVVEFYLQAQDREGNLRNYPAVIAPTDSTRTANLLYQVDYGTYTGAQPLYRMVMTEVERAELYALGRQFPDADSDAAMNATWVSSDSILSGGTTTQFRYNVGVRNRGHGTRVANPNNYHVDVPTDRPWKGVYGINLNANYAHSQVLGSAIFRRLGVPMPDSRPVQLRVNGTNLMVSANGNSYGSYAANEQYNNDFVKRSWPLDPEGNSYRTSRQPVMSGPSPEADLTWHGADFFASGSYTNAYFKQNNILESDYSDLIRLIGVLSLEPGYSSAETYVQDVARVLEVEQWMKYMAINTLLANTETCLANGVGDDYALYRGLDDPRFQLLPYDMDSVMGRGLSATPSRNGIWRMTALPVMDRFMKTPEFAPIYFGWLQTLSVTAFAPERMNPLVEQVLGNYVPQSNLDTMKVFNSNQVAYVLSQFPHVLAVAHDLPTASGYPHTTSATVALHGTGNAVETRKVMVNGVAAEWTAWQGTWTNNAVELRPGLNQVLVQAIGAAGTETERANIDIWYDDGSTHYVGGTVSQSTTWTAVGGPYHLTNNLTIASGATLTIESGSTVYLSSNVNFVVASGGRLLAEGTEQAPIRFSLPPGVTASWGGITINGAPGSPETRMAYVHFEGNNTTCIEVAGGTIYLDHATFGTTSHQYLALDDSSFLLSHCVFPTSSAGFELLHGTGGIKTGGRGIIRDCFFGTTTGYNDIFDFTGGNRPDEAILQLYNNVFMGTGDDLLDLDGTDAWIEGNIFLHVHRNGAPDSSAAVSGGSSGGDTSEITIVGNLFYDCDNAITAKQGNFYTLVNNTIVRMTKAGGQDFDSGAINLRDTTPDITTFGRGCYLEGNIVADVEKLARNYDPAQTSVTFSNNILPLAWTGPGGGNQVVDPLLTHIPELSETYFTSWEEAQIMRRWFSPRHGSPARGTGPNGRDMGGVIPFGVSLAGEPQGTNTATTATLSVGWKRTGNGIPTDGFPLGSGFTHYQWRLDGGEWSAETPIATPITMADLANGPHYVEAIGKNDAGWYQNDPVLGTNALVTASRTWVVDTNYVAPAVGPTIRINEILAKNQTTLTNLGATPDLIELYNYGSQPVDLAGMGLTDNADLPYKFTFPANTSLAAGAYLVLAADGATGGALAHTGFTLKQTGDDLSLFDKAATGGALLDQVQFGLQLADYSIGRLAGGVWGLCRPTFGSANVAQLTGDTYALRINEWLADAQFVARNDFIELYNPEPLPVELGGLYLSDASGSPARFAIAPLSYIAADGLTEFIADSDPSQGADHLNFKLSPEVGLILLSAPDLRPIDAINYGTQRTDVSQGRSPNGGDTLTSFPQPTPGGANPGSKAGEGTITTVTVPLLAMNAPWRFNQTANLDGVAWYKTNYSDASWPSGPALLAVEDCDCLPAPGIGTNLTLGRMTYYFRTTFVVETNLADFKLNLTTVVDDGALVYLNGQRVLTNGLNTGTPIYSTTASRNVGNAGTEYFVLPATGLVMGTNVVAVEVHQTSSGSSDIVWGMALDASLSVTNVLPGSVVPVVLNEVLANHQSTESGGIATDYVELYNPSSNAVDLAEMSLTDDAAFSRKWVFPVGTILPAGGYLAIGCDASLAPSATNAAFNLSAAGGAVFLFNKPDSGGLIDALHYGLQTPGYSVARLPDGTGNWTLGVPTPEGPNVEAGLGSVSSLRINEWMADPAGGNDWFEVFNSGSQPVALGGLFLTDDLANQTQSPIPPLSFIGTGANGFLKFIADNGASSEADHVNFSLKKSGEALGLFSPSGAMLDGIMFGAQVTGVSQGRFPDGSTSFASFKETASPGESNYLPIPNAVINEVLTHTDPPLEDAVELFNPTPETVNIGGWYLSNAKSELKKFRIPDGTVLAGSGFAVFYEGDFNSTNGIPFGFNSAHGDYAILSQADPNGDLTGYRAEVKFGAAENGVAMGRYPTSVGFDFTTLSARTFGADSPGSVEDFRKGRGLPNAAAKVGPVVINEIMYAPVTGGVENSAEEYLELVNLTGTPVPLYDPASPLNTWKLRDAVDFEFPVGVTLAPGEAVLVVGFDPANMEALAAFRTKFSVPGSVTIFGPWLGRLDNGGDSVELVKPDAVQMPPHPDAGYVPQILVDRVRYEPVAPWPNASGNGMALTRLSAGGYGNEPTNWVAAAPTAGKPNGGDVNDTDGDGLPDAWEMLYFGTLARDGTGDFDSDGMTDLQEHRAGTSPVNPADVLRLLSVAFGNSTVLEFSAVAGRTYTVQYRDSLGEGAWQTLAEVLAQPVSGVVRVTDATSPDASRFYRVVTAAQP